MKRRVLLAGGMAAGLAGRAGAQPVPLGGPAGYQKVKRGGAFVGANPLTPTQNSSFMTSVPAGFTYACASATTDLLWTDPSGKTITDYAINVPRFLANGLLCEGTRANRMLNSATPASHTTLSCPAGSYVAWCNGPGTLAIAAGTAIGTGFGTVTQGNPITITVTTLGTMVATVTGTLFAIQLEQLNPGEAAVPSSFMKSGAGNLVRAPTIVSATTVTGLNLAACTYVVESYLLNATFTSARFIEFSGTVAGNNFDRVFVNSGTSLRATSTANAVAQPTVVSGTTLTVNAIHKVGYATAVGSQILCIDGTTPGTQTGSTARPVDLVSLTLLAGVGGATACLGFLRRFQYWPIALSSSQLQQVTT